MISKKSFTKGSRCFCKTPELIENYEQAINDKTQVWDCHHRDEIRVLPSGMIAIRTKEELIENGRYYNCPPNELIFLTKAEHIKLHTEYYTNEHKQKIREALTGTKHTKERVEKMRNSLKGKKLSEETKKKLSASLKGRVFTEEHKRRIGESNKGKTSPKGITHSEFGRKFKEHYGITYCDNPTLYRRERNWYLSHNKVCSWEAE